jgi:hypothetical protein
MQRFGKKAKRLSANETATWGGNDEFFVGWRIDREAGEQAVGRREYEGRGEG